MATAAALRPLLGLEAGRLPWLHREARASPVASLPRRSGPLSIPLTSALPLLHCSLPLARVSLLAPLSRCAPAPEAAAHAVHCPLL